MTRKKKIFWIVVALCVVSSLYFLLQYRCDQAWIRGKVLTILPQDRPLTHQEQILVIRDYVRAHVSCEGVDIDDRPFLRASARETLETGKGYCGEAARAFICLANSIGINARRVNLIGRINHVVVEVEMTPDRWVVVDPMHLPETNAIIDRKAWTVEQLVSDSTSPFSDYSTINMRRVPVVNLFVQRVKLYQSWFTWMLENPPLIKAGIFGLAAVTLLLLLGLDRLLFRFYLMRHKPQAAGTRSEQLNPEAGTIHVRDRGRH